jgi:hypothetical protein
MAIAASWSRGSLTMRVSVPLEFFVDIPAVCNESGENVEMALVDRETNVVFIERNSDQ